MIKGGISASEQWNLTPTKIMLFYSIMAAWYAALIQITADHLPGAICIAVIVLLAGIATASLSRTERGSGE